MRCNDDKKQLTEKCENELGEIAEEGKGKREKRGKERGESKRKGERQGGRRGNDER